MDAVNPVLAHKIGLSPTKTDPAEGGGAPTPMRQMRRALGRSADKALGLSASVLGIAQEDLEVEDLIESGPEGWVVLGLRDGDHAGLTGLFLIDPQLRSAVIEMLTMGNLLPPSEDQRGVTRTDAVMAVPFADQLLKELAEVGFGSGAFDPAAYDMGPIDDLRTAGLVMTQGLYRSWRITVQMGGGERQGEMLIALRPQVETPPAATKAKPDWSEALRAALDEAPVELDAMLTRMVLPINKIEEFEVGQVLHLAGTTVGSVSLTGPSGKVVATARLGQVAGKRAVRIETDVVELQDSAPDMAPAEPEARSVAAPDLVEG